MENPAFTALRLSEPLLRAVEAAGYTTPTPVQAQAIPEVLAGRDLMVCAQTGTGKTAAFMLPALQRLAAGTVKRPIGAPRILVLTPTRELAQQVTDAALTYGKFLRHATIAAIVRANRIAVGSRMRARMLESSRLKRRSKGFIYSPGTTPGRPPSLQGRGR